MKTKQKIGPNESTPWWIGETMIPLSGVPKYCPRRVHRSAVYRWTEGGLQGVYLRWFQAGGTRATTVEELNRFFAALTQTSEAMFPDRKRPCAQFWPAVMNADLSAASTII